MISEGKDVLKCVNDALLHDVNLEKNFWKTCNYISLCDKNGITFNPKKFQFGQDEVKFAGFKIIKSHMRPQREYLQAILDFPKPTDITVVRSWFGLVNQVVYSFCMTRHMELFRAVHKPAQIFQWDEHLEEAFVMSKKEIVKAVEEGVRIFDMNRTTCLAPDWCKSGVGFFLLQKYCRCTEVTPRCFPEGWKLVFAGARFCSPAEAKHKPVEGEALAVVNGLQKCRYFVLGCKDLVVGTNHKPLLKVLGDRRLEDIKNPRLESLKKKDLAVQIQDGSCPRPTPSKPRCPLSLRFRSRRRGANCRGGKHTGGEERRPQKDEDSVTQRRRPIRGRATVHSQGDGNPKSRANAESCNLRQSERRHSLRPRLGTPLQPGAAGADGGG